MAPLVPKKLILRKEAFGSVPPQGPLESASEVHSVSAIWTTVHLWWGRQPRAVAVACMFWGVLEQNRPTERELLMPDVEVFLGGLWLLERALSAQMRKYLHKTYVCDRVCLGK